MKVIQKHFDVGSWLVIVVTLALFIVALFIKGFTHDLLLEAGIFLVSVKLILMTYKNGAATDALQRKLDEIHLAIGRMEKKTTAP